MISIKRNEDVGVVIGRFQINKLHDGHKALLDYVCEQHNKVIILIGCSRVVNDKNPLDYITRMSMIREAYPSTIILPVPDSYTNTEWSKNVDKAISSTLSGNQSVVIYGSRDSFIPYYEGRFATQELDSSLTYSATNEREVYRVKAINSSDFRAGMIYSKLTAYAAVVPTVDIAVRRDDTLLLVKRNTEPGWRLPGGYCETCSGSYEQDAKREIAEECGIETGELVYLGSCKIDDWRYNASDTIRTTLFGTRYVFGSIKADDDVDLAKFFPIDELPIIVKEHQLLIEMVKEKWNKI